MNSRTSILIVDDASEVIETLAAMLGDDEFEIIRADSGVSGLELIESGVRIDIILSDYGMPGLNGSEFFRALTHSGINVPFILMSGHPALDIQKFISEGMADFIQKPFDRSRVLACLKKTLEGSWLPTNETF